MVADGVFFRVLGPLAVSAGDCAVAPPRSPVLQGLLGALILAGGEPLPTGRLADLVWTDRAPETSRESVHVAVSRLRKWLARLDPAQPGLIKISYRDGYLLEGAEDRSDLGGFLASAGEARSMTGSAARCETLSSAFAERRGPLLAGLTRLNRADPLVRGIEDGIRLAAMDLAAVALEAGAPQRAVSAVTTLTEEFPFDEPLHAALIDLLTVSGRPAEALQVYRRLSEQLSVELGIEPSVEVRRAHLRVLSADRAGVDGAPVERASTGRASTGRASTGRASTGRASGERVLDDGGASAEVPATPVPAQLPPDILDFTGRADEVAELVDTLVRGAGSARRGTVAMATVAGMGGMGKTTLALHVAHQVSNVFIDGQLYADLHGDRGNPAEPADVLGRFLRVLGMPGAGIPPSLEERVALYRSRLAGRRMLIVLDNVAGEAQARPLLPGTTEAAVLITSRNRLIGLEGAKLLNLDVLPSAQAVDLIRSIIGARRVAAEPEVAVEIAELCGHVPLAVRIAAARLLGRDQWMLSHLADVLREERRRLDELVAGDLEVRAGFEMSYRLLPVRTRRAFRMAGLLQAPDFACWTVAALLDVPVAEAHRHLETLVDAHLAGVAGVDETGQLRYRLHDLLRLYARELAEREDPPAQREAAVQRAWGGWLALAEKAAERVPGPCYAAMHGDALRWKPPAGLTARLLADPMRWFAAERAALMAEVAHACDRRQSEVAWDLAASMERYCDVRGLYDDWRRMHERALALCQEVGDRRGEAVLLRGLLEVTTWTSPAGSGPTMARMRVMADRLFELFTEMGHPSGTNDAMVAMVWGKVADGEIAEALVIAERALRIARQAGYVGGQARTLHVMAVAHGEADPRGALQCLERALVVVKELGNPRFLATIVQFLGAAQALCGDITGGRELLEESIVMARDLDDRYLETFSLLYLAKLFVLTGDERARATLDLTLAYSQAGNFRHHLADALGVLGELNLAEGDLPGAVASLERSVEVWRTRGWIPFLARTLRTLGDAHAASGDHAAARAAWAEARGLFDQIDDDAGRTSTEDRLAAGDMIG